MKLSLRGEYALRALLVLGMNYTPEVVRIQTISEQQKIPERFGVIGQFHVRWMPNCGRSL